MADPAITVLMTVYNAGQYLNAAIKSVLDQSYRDFEFLIIDDASTDESLSVIKSFADPRIRVCSNPQNLGQTKSLNEGLKLSHGKYIARIDADDIALPGWLDDQYEFIRHHPEYAVVGVYGVIIGKNGGKRSLLKIPSSWDDIVLRSLVASPLNHGGCLMNKETILENGGYPEDLSIAADYMLWSDLLDRNIRITTNPVVGMAIRFHESSISVFQRNEKAFIETARIMRKNIERFTEVTISEEQAQLLWKTCLLSQDLDEVQWRQGIGILKEVFSHIRGSLNIEKAKALKVLEAQILTVHVKRMFAFIQRDQISECRKLIKDYLREFGVYNIFVCFFVCSWFGKYLLRGLPGLYAYKQKMFVQYQFKT